MENMYLEWKRCQGGVPKDEGSSLTPLERKVCCSLCDNPRPSSLKGLVQIEFDLIAQNVITGSGQFVGDSLDGDYAVGFGHLSLIVSLDVVVVTNRKVSGFNKGP